MKPADLVLAHPTLEPQRLARGHVTRVSNQYVWCALDGHRDRLRVARTTLEGPYLYGDAWTIRSCTPEEHSGLERRRALDGLATSVYLVADLLRRGQWGRLGGEPVELERLALELRALVVGDGGLGERIAREAGARDPGTPIGGR